MLAYRYMLTQPGLTAEIFGIVVLIFSVIAHEVAHGYAAYALGDATAKRAGRLTLNPLAHIDPMGSVIIPALLILTNSPIRFGWAKPVPYNPYNLKNQRWGEAIVASAGVLTNLLLAVVFAIVARVAAGYGMSSFASLATLIVYTNLFLGLFNLIPIPPLDGYGILHGVMPLKWSYPLRNFENRLRSGGIFTLIFVLLFISLFLSGPLSALVSYVFTLLVGAPLT
jgi:Zn-dependent protease